VEAEVGFSFWLLAFLSVSGSGSLSVVGGPGGDAGPQTQTYSGGGGGGGGVINLISPNILPIADAINLGGGVNGQPTNATEAGGPGEAAAVMGAMVALRRSQAQ